MTVFQALNEFLIDQQIKRNSPRTIEYYQSSIMIFSDYIKDKSVSSLNIHDLKSYSLYLMNRPNIKDITVQSYVRALRVFLNWLYDESYIETKLTDKYRLPKVLKPVIDILTETEIKRLMSCFNLKNTVQLRNYCICLLMLDSGLRMNEAITLDINKIHLNEGYIIVDGKGNKQRIVPIGLNTRKYLTKYLSQRPQTLNHTRIFVKDQQTPIKISTVRQFFRRLKKQTSIPRLHPHLLRHTFATRYIESGGDIYTLQSILGHTTLDMVKKYVHFTPSKTVAKFSDFSIMDNLKK